ncbi:MULTISPECIES: peroxiredoxin [unclassified Leptolyngbya]|uniref:peroxiredoxin n=1 Tax=unclassified Leptolyngbya TaxID=2650499 RepID=UPI00168722B9|nr:MULTISPECIES: peroxiredoxin [unclassified Leptolyngbya]MBD1911900.1 peroxiredoxin [Leptolyngbya sp. FACHB-8]MBD2156109.1 peroxiredoxin [Leptolyngbya sp. FACHB-16]
MAVITRVPSVVFKTRVRDESIPGPNPYRWQDLTTEEIFSGKKVVLFALPGAFTPTCSSSHLPRYEELYEEFQAHGVDQIICLSVNDAFVMFQWGKQQGAKNVFLLPDGNGDFTRRMGMLVDKSNLGFGMRSWRYSMLVNDGNIEKIFIEEEFGDNCPVDPFEVSDADTMLAYLKGVESAGVSASRKEFVG